MKKISFVLLVMFSTTLLTAQTISIKKTYTLPSMKAYNTVLNEDGSLLAFTSESYVGLGVYNLDNGAVTNITDEEGAGFQPAFSSDNNKVFYKNTVYEARLRKDGVKSFDFRSRDITPMVKPGRDVRHPQAYENGILVLTNNQLVRSTFGKTNAPVDHYAWSDGSNLYIFKNGKRHILNPVKDANGYIWTSLSPNGKYILSNAIGQGAFICDLDGKVVAQLGYLNAAVWYGDDFVVGMIDRDDGHVVTESTVVIKSIDGKAEKTLSPTGKIAMYPAASERGAKVAFNTDKGEVHVVELEIKR